MSSLSLLPSQKTEFSSQAYWDNFFLNLKAVEPGSGKQKSANSGVESFEWYGSWTDISSLVNRSREILLKARSRANSKCLIVGCGNSSLSRDMYDEGYTNVTSIDFSPVVIEEMREKNKDVIPNSVDKIQMQSGLRFLLMDVLNMPNEWGECFDIIIDKGAFDALFSDDTSELREKADKMLSEIVRVMSPEGIYVCVSLAQPFVLDFLLKYFQKDTGFCVRIFSFDPYENSLLCPFLFVIQKSDEETYWLIQLDEGPGVPCYNYAEIDGLINERRMFFDMQKRLHGDASTKGLKSKFSLALQNKADPRYHICVVDSGLSVKAQNIRCGAFIVPQGREHEWVFSHAEGQIQIATDNKVGRLAFISLGRGHEFGDVKEIQKELSPIMIDLAPADMPKEERIPFFGIGEDIGNRRIIFESESSMSGRFVVEEVEISMEGEDCSMWHRRLIFLNNPNCVQSEVRLEPSQEHVDRNHTGNSYEEEKQKGNRLRAINKSYLVFEIHQAMIAALQIIPQFQRSHGEENRVLLIGLGGGALASYLSQSSWLGNMYLEVVELDPALVQVAKDYFALDVNSTKLKIFEEDGLQFVEKIESPYDVVIIDVDSKDTSDAVLAPSKEFMTDRILRTLYERACTWNGGIVLNLACISKDQQGENINQVVRAFDHVFALPLEDCGDANTVITAIKSKDKQISLEAARRRLKEFDETKDSVYHLHEYLDQAEEIRPHTKP